MRGESENREQLGNWEGLPGLAEEKRSRTAARSEEHCLPKNRESTQDQVYASG